MATGSFFAAFNYRFWVKLATTAATAPTSASGMQEVLSLDNAGIQISSNTVDVLDYGSSFGFSASLVTGQSYTIPMSMNLNLKDPGYLVLKEASLEAVQGTTVQWYRTSPSIDPNETDYEVHAGVAFVSDFSEDITAGNVAKVNFTLTGYGAPVWFSEDNGTGTTTGTGTGTGT